MTKILCLFMVICTLPSLLHSQITNGQINYEIRAMQWYQGCDNDGLSEDDNVCQISLSSDGSTGGTTAWNTGCTQGGGQPACDVEANWFTVTWGADAPSSFNYSTWLYYANNRNSTSNLNLRWRSWEDDDLNYYGAGEACGADQTGNLVYNSASKTPNRWWGSGTTSGSTTGTADNWNWFLNGNVGIMTSWRYTYGAACNTPLTFGTLTSGVTYSHSNSNRLAPANSINGTGYSNVLGNASPDVFYSFTLSQPSTVVISTVNGYTNYDTYLRLYEAGGGCGYQIAFNDDASGVQSQISTQLGCGTYTVVVEGFSNNSGDFRLDLTATNSGSLSISGTVTHESSSPCAANGAINSVNISGGMADVRYIRIVQNTGNYMNFAGLRAYQILPGTPGTVDVAAGRGGSASSLYAATGQYGPVTNLTDNNATTCFHNANANVGEWVEVDLTAGYDLDRISIQNRQDCCYDRAASLTLILRNAAGNVVSTRTITLTNAANAAYQDFNVLDASWSDGATTLNRTGLNPSCTNSTYTLSANDLCANTSNGFVVNDGTQTSGNPATFGSNQWNTYAYVGQNIDLTGICYYGYYTHTGLGFDTRTQWVGAENGTPASAAGYVGCDPGVDNHTIVSKRQGFPCGSYELRSTYNDDVLRIYVNGVAVHNDPNWDANVELIGTYLLDASSTIEVRTTEGGGGSGQAITLTLVSSSSAPTSVTGGGTYCHGNSVTLTANGGSLGPGGVYRWYTGSCGGTLVYTGNPYTFTASTSGATNYYVRVEGTCGNTACAPVATVTLPTAGTALATNGQSATCNVGAGQTVRFYHTGTGNYIATVTAGATGLGNTTATTYVDGTNAIVPACADPTNVQFQTAVMQRHWLINPTVSAAATVRLPYTGGGVGTEYGNLQVAAAASGSSFDAVTGQGSIKLSKYTNSTTPALMNASATDNCTSGATTIHNSSSTGTTAPAPGVAAWYSDFAIPGFSEFWLHGSNNNSPLPVELSSFIAECNVEGNKVEVNWATASEHNSSYFEVERSFDGTIWDVVNSVPAAGNSSQILSYNIVDAANEIRGHEVIYYRLNQFDTDGEMKMYGPTTATCISDFVGMELFPNPASTIVNIVLHGEYDNSTSIVITDAQGKEIWQIKYDEKEGKLYTVDVESLTPGVYFVRLIGNDENIQVVRFVKR